MQDSVCPDRLKIGQRVARARQEVYRARKEYADATTVSELRAMAFEKDRLWAAIQDARAEQESAEKEFSQHIEKHGCIA